MENKNEILGCFVSITHPYPDAKQEEKDLAVEQGKLFKEYIWGTNGISLKLKKLINSNYGVDLKLALLEFFVNPLPMQVISLKEVEAFRKNEKSISLPIIINSENFFSRNNTERVSFLKNRILQKINLLSEVVKKKKLDTNISLLKSDLEKVLKEY